MGVIMYGLLIIFGTVIGLALVFAFAIGALFAIISMVFSIVFGKDPDSKK
jgi:hypothetical protein